MQTVKDLKDAIQSVRLSIMAHPDYQTLNDDETIGNVDTLSDVILSIEGLLSKAYAAGQRRQYANDHVGADDEAPNFKEWFINEST